MTNTTKRESLQAHTGKKKQPNDKVSEDPIRTNGNLGGLNAPNVYNQDQGEKLNLAHQGHPIKPIFLWSRIDYSSFFSTFNPKLHTFTLTFTLKHLASKLSHGKISMNPVFSCQYGLYSTPYTVKYNKLTLLKRICKVFASKKKYFMLT